jgi:hypothetical protein
MKAYKYLTLVLAVTLLIAACSPAITPTAQPKPTIAPTTLPTPAPTATGPNTGLQTRPEAHAWANAPQAALAARAMLVAQLAIDPDTIGLVSVDQMEWSDACLGVQLPGKMCAQVITSGYKIILSAKDQQYEFHTNADGSSVLQADQGLSSNVVKPGGMMMTQQEAQRWANSPQAALAARLDLMQRISVDPDTIGLISIEEVQWPDGCLGVIDPAKTCLAAVTPGYKIVFSGAEKQYEYHTNADGSDLVLVNP